MLHIRPFNFDSEDDYAQVVGIDNKIWVDYPNTTDEWRHWDRTRPTEFFYRRDVLELDGQIVGFVYMGEPAATYKPGKYFIGGAIDPAFQRRGFGGQAFAHGLAQIQAREPKLEVLSSDTREDKDAAIAFLEKHGFKKVMRYPTSRLDVAAMDTSAYDGLLEKVAAQGIELLPVSVLKQRDPDTWMHKYWELTNDRILPDVPMPDPWTGRPFEEFVERRIKNPNFDPSSIFMAVDNGEYVGISALTKPQAYNGMLYTGLTGVQRSHRRKGIATALKIHAINYAKSIEAHTIETDNEEKNPMYDINMMLGFKPFPAWADFHREFGG